MVKTEKSKKPNGDVVMRIWCRECTGEKVQVLEWINPNSWSIIDPMGEVYVDDLEQGARDAQTWCEDCLQHTVLERGWVRNVEGR